MSNEQDARRAQDVVEAPVTVEMPKPTVAPLTLALGMVILAAGAPFGLPFIFLGAFLLITGIGIWVTELLPGKGHLHEPLVGAAQRAQPVSVELNRVEHLRPGKPGYRARLPEAVHPLSAGIMGGVVGGLVMPLPALLYGVLSGHGVWYPVNLLAAMVVPGMGTMNVMQLEQFSLVLLLIAVFIHATMAVVFGLLYGVLLPMLPAIPRLSIPKSLAWGGIVFPLLWTAVSYGLMGVTNPVLQGRVDWPWFVVSQFVFGAVAAFVVDRSEKIPVPPAGGRFVSSASELGK